MMAPDGQIWEDLAGGNFKPGLILEKDWWFENHPGCNADNSGGRYTDNRPSSGDERTIRTTYNPAVQFMFVRTQCQVASNRSSANTGEDSALPHRLQGTDSISILRFASEGVASPKDGNGEPGVN